MANTYLTKTPSSAGNRKTWTWSAWIKRSSGLGSQQCLLACSSGATVFHLVYFDGNDKLVHNYNQTFCLTERVFRDTNAWYHLVCAVDTTQSTASNRVKFYVNGVQETLSGNFPSQNTDMTINNNVRHDISNGGANFSNNFYFDGSMSHIHFIDGTAYDATAFGETDANGVWKIKTSPSVTYGTNGFFILKDGNSVTDQSPNTNNFTVGGGNLTNTEDSPSNVFATMNPLNSVGTGTNPTFSNGNLRVVSAGGTSNFGGSSTLGVTSGKWYIEAKATVGNGANNYSRNEIGVSGEASNLARLNTNLSGGSATNSSVYYKSENGNAGINTVDSYTGSTYITGDIIGIALDMDNLKIYFSKNGVWQNSGDPTSGSTGTGAITIPTISSTTDGAYFVVNSDNSGVPDATSEFDFNFGNGYFGTTAVSSAGTNASGIGIFEYDVPTGYTALSTKGLNL